MATTTSIGTGPKLWTPGDWNALFGFGTNILVNLLVLTGLLQFVLKMPPELVFGRILPALGLMMFLSTGYYAWLAYQLAKKTGRDDVCALPSGISVPHMFVVTFVIMLPIATATGDPVKGWEAGLVWVFFQSFILMIGGFVAPWIPPRHAARRPARHAGRRLHRLHLDAPGARDVPHAGHRRLLPRDHPRRLVRRPALPARHPRRPRRHRLRHGDRLGLGLALGFPIGGMSLGNFGAAFANFGFSIPIPAIDHVFSGFDYLGVILVTAIPFGIYDLVEALDNVESAEAAGDHYPTTRVLTADGVVSLIGCLMGNPFINAVYIGHPGWKSMGGRIGYSFATGVMVLVLCWFGIIAVLLALVPVVAISPILLYIGMLIGAQAFQTTPTRHAPAIIVALLPNIAAWGLTMINGALGAAGVPVTPELIQSMAGGGVLYEGLQILGDGAILAGLILAAITVFIIEREFEKGAAFALAGAVLTFFGFMHGQSLGINVTPSVALAYLMVAGFLMVCARYRVAEPGMELEPGMQPAE